MKTIPLLRATLALVAAALAAASGGCSAYQVKFDSIARAPTPGAAPLASYKIRNANPALTSDSLRFKEAAQMLKTALSGHGLWEAPDARSADMVVDLDYGVEVARIEYSPIEVPVLPPLSESRGGLTPASAQGRLRPFGNQSAATAEDAIRYAEAYVPIRLYEKHLTVSCRENQSADEGRLPVELWRIDASLESEGTDLRACLPVLAAVVMEELGTTTAGETIRTMNANDEAIRFIEKGL